jgi:hypothetical protein
MLEDSWFTWTSIDKRQQMFFKDLDVICGLHFVRNKRQRHLAG